MEYIFTKEELHSMIKEIVDETVGRMMTKIEESYIIVEKP